MNCSQAEMLIQTALDGRLSPAERLRLDAHAAHCDACRAAWDEYRRLGQTVTDWTRRPADPDDPGDVFTAQVMAQIAQAGSRRTTRRRLAPQLGGLFGSLAALVALSCWVGPVLMTHLPPLSVQVPPTLSSNFVNGLWQMGADSARAMLSAWDGLTAQAVPTLPHWLWGAMAVALGVNGAFVWQARRPIREAASR